MTRTQAGWLKLADTHDIHHLIPPLAPEAFGPQLLELSVVLQTTLDVDKQMELFLREIRRHVELDGLEYEHPGEHLHIRIAEQALHRASYDLVVQSQSLGELRFYRQAPFQAKDLEQLENLLCALTYPLRNALTYRRAVERALRDPLTGVQNRIALDQALEREFELARRQGVPLSLILLDIDNFKQVNDNYGHSFGDDVLTAVAHTVAATVRRCDLLFRFGGEEFVVLTSHTDQTGVIQLAERIRHNVAAIGSVGGREMKVTVSLGTATLTDDDSGKALFDRADRAMYQAKEAGRDRVVSV